jgi:6-phosphogluconolactonase
MRLTLCVLGLTIIQAAVAPVTRARAERVVYVGTYTEKTASKGIYAFRFNDSSGALTPVGLVAETPSPSFLTASSNGRFVYAVNELQSFGDESSGSVTAFAWTPAQQRSRS